MDNGKEKYAKSLVKCFDCVYLRNEIKKDMREIKFKAKRVDGKMWVYGCLLVTKYNSYIMPLVDEFRNAIEQISVIPETVCQFTGLKDNNGNDIYEGDYLLDKYTVDEVVYDSLLPVVWCDKSLSWCVDSSFKKDGSYLVPLLEFFGEHREIKGNIHDKK